MPADLDAIARMMVNLLIQQAGSAQPTATGGVVPATPGQATAVPATPGQADGQVNVPATPGMSAPATPGVAPGTPGDVSHLQLAIPDNRDVERCNSASHPKEFAAFKRWAEANKGEIQNAWNKGGGAKMAAFKKFVMANCNPLAVEAVMRFQVYSETENKDEGEYYTYEDLLKYYDGNALKADDLRSKRRRDGGTSTCRNSGEETYILYGREKKSHTTKTMETHLHTDRHTHDRHFATCMQYIMETNFCINICWDLYA